MWGGGVHGLPNLEKVRMLYVRYKIWTGIGLNQRRCLKDFVVKTPRALENVNKFVGQPTRSSGPQPTLQLSNPSSLPVFPANDGTRAHPSRASDWIQGS